MFRNVRRKPAHLSEQQLKKYIKYIEMFINVGLCA